MTEAVNNTRNLGAGHVNKLIYLNQIFDDAETAATNLATIEISEWGTDFRSEAFVNLKRELSNALGRNAAKTSADGVLLTAIIAAASAELA